MGVKTEVLIPKDDFLKLCTDNPKAVEDGYTGGAISTFIIKNSLSKKGAGTLKTLSKKKLIEIAVNDVSSKEIPTSNGSDNMASNFIDAVDKAKTEFHGTGLSKLTKQLAENSIQRLFERFEPSRVAQIGVLGHIGVILLLVLDLTFKDLKTAPTTFLKLIKPNPNKKAK